MLFLSALQLNAQHKVGVRAGLNYSSFNGPLEQNESFGTSSGFHFGINYTYQLPNNLGFRAELLYVQRGAKQVFRDSMAQYLINPIIPSNAETFLETGNLEYELDITPGYLSIPLTAHYRLKRFELFAGASLDFLVGSSGKGRADFRSTERGDGIRFVQSLDHAYNSDEAGEYNTFLRENVIILVDGEQVTIPKVVGAYYNYTSEQRDAGNRINSFNAHLIGGVNYFLNRAFYMGLRYEYGLMDVTNNSVDPSLVDYDANNNYTFREDFDRPYSISVSFGFRF